MKKKVVRINTGHDRTVTVYVGDKEVASTNYDEAGWSGMEAFESGIEAVAKALGATVKKTEGEEEIEDDEATDAE